MNYKQTLEYIHSLGNFSMPPTLNRIKSVLEALGNPQNAFKAIHIAGTNGKGSVSAMLHSVFKAAGYKTGLYVSPFIIDFRERIQINGDFIPKRQLSVLAKKVIKTGVALTEFEFITAIAFLFFAGQKCDIAIVETGLGGRLDATNALTEVLASVITKIGLDHTAILGDTIEKIAAEKCGIVKNAPLITSFNQPPKAAEVLNGYNPIIPQKEALTLLESGVGGNAFIYKQKHYETRLSGEHQAENAAIVIETATTLGVADVFIKEGLSNAFFPARMEVISNRPLVVLDGAHNPDGAEALSKMMKQYNGKITAVVGMCKDKDCQKVLSLTLPNCRKMIALEIADMPRSLTAEQLLALAKPYCECSIAANYDEALEKIKQDEVIFVFGSLYLASSIREKIKNFFKS